MVHPIVLVLHLAGAPGAAANRAFLQADLLDNREIANSKCDAPMERSRRVICLKMHHTWFSRVFAALVMKIPGSENIGGRCLLTFFSTEQWICAYP